jgi:N4-(beta-N-acetylglucosaminyl)-L-asparaginase
MRRIARNFNNDMKKLRYMQMIYYVLRKDGAYAGVSLWSKSPSGKPRTFAVNDGQPRLEQCAFLFDGEPLGFPPTLNSKQSF